VPPRYCLLLNVMRDQLDRFGEIDHTADMLQIIAEATTDTVVLNREDPRIARIAERISGKTIRYFGLAPDLLSQFPSDDDMHGETKSNTTTKNADVILKSLNDDQATYVIDKNDVSTHLKLSGIYNVYNSAAALALVRAIVGEKCDNKKLLGALSE